MDTMEVISNEPENRIKYLSDLIFKNQELTNAKINILNDKLNSVEKEDKQEFANILAIMEDKFSVYYSELSNYIDNIKNNMSINVKDPSNEPLQESINNLHDELSKLVVETRTTKFRVDGIDFNFKEFYDNINLKIKEVEQLGNKLGDIILHLDIFEKKMIDKFSKDIKDVIYFDTKHDLDNHNGNLNIPAIVKQGIFKKGAYYYDGYTWRKV